MFANNYGSSVAIDVNTIVVGTAVSGYAYVYRATAGFVFETRLRPVTYDAANDGFGITVAVQGDTIAVGDPREASSGRSINGPDADSDAVRSGAVYVFTRSGGVWNQEAFIKASSSDLGDGLGAAVALDGSLLVAAAPRDGGSGAAVVFERSGTQWSEGAYLKPGLADPDDGFYWVGVWGDLVAAGAFFEDSDASGVDGNPGSNSAAESGAAYVFARRSTGWSTRAYVKASNTGAGDQFGIGVTLGRDALLVGANLEDGPGQGLDPPSQGNGLSGSLTDDSGAVYCFR